MMSKSPTTTDPNWLHNSHAGELLVLEFMEPLGLDAGALALALDVPCDQIDAVIAGERPVDAELISA